MYVIAFDWYKNAWVLYFSSLTFFFCYYSSSRSILYLCLCAPGSFLWKKCVPLSDCRYATASARSDGLLLLSGGRDANSVVRAMNRHLLKSRTSSSIPGRLIGKVVVACSHLILRMDLLSIETDGGSGLSLLASRLLQDTNMQQWVCTENTSASTSHLSSSTSWLPFS